MSLGVYLTENKRKETCYCNHCDHAHERDVEDTVYDANITHNLGRMASEAGIYDAVWRPDEHGITKAAQLVEILRAGIAAMRAEPDKFRAFDAPNGWGRYDDFLPWLQRYLAACEQYPDADVSVSR